jgi:hypothetical protein
LYPMAFLKKSGSRGRNALKHHIILLIERPWIRRSAGLRKTDQFPRAAYPSHFSPVKGPGLAAPGLFYDQFTLRHSSSAPPTRSCRRRASVAPFYSGEDSPRQECQRRTLPGQPAT